MLSIIFLDCNTEYILFSYIVEEKPEPIALVKTFDSMLAAYEGFCNLKQVFFRLPFTMWITSQKLQSTLTEQEVGNRKGKKLVVFLKFRSKLV